MRPDDVKVLIQGEEEDVDATMEQGLSAQVPDERRVKRPVPETNYLLERSFPTASMSEDTTLNIPAIAISS
jgi:hypothetical protein